MSDNKTIQTGSNPWEQDNQENMDNWPTAYAGSVDTGAPTVVGNGNAGTTSAPTVVGNSPYAYNPPQPVTPQPPNYGSPMPPQLPNYNPTPPQYGTPQPYAGAPQPYAPQPQMPQQNVPPSGASTVMMEVMRDTIPLAWLAVVEGPGAARGTVYTLQKETLLGRAAGEIVLGMDPAISTQHLKVRLEASEQDPDQQVFVLYDMASANGVFVGDYEACKNDKANRTYRHELKDSDFLLVGQTILVFKAV